VTLLTFVDSTTRTQDQFPMPLKKLAQSPIAQDYDLPLLMPAQSKCQSASIHAMSPCDANRVSSVIPLLEIPTVIIQHRVCRSSQSIHFSLSCLRMSPSRNRTSQLSVSNPRCRRHYFAITPCILCGIPSICAHYVSSVRASSAMTTPAVVLTPLPSDATIRCDVRTAADKSRAGRVHPS
jgi:hypothetical protein